jgi:hypothetical protein
MPQTWNRYIYAHNSPTGWIDPTGLVPTIADGPTRGWIDPETGTYCVNCKEKEPTDEDREDAGAILGSESDEYNCHSMTFHYGNGDPTDSRNAGAPPGWDRYGDDDLALTQRLDDDEPNRFHDIVAYGRDTDGDGFLDLNEVLHTGRVIGTDSEGNTTKVIGKFGNDAVHIHHPAARGVEELYGPIRAYFRD